MKRILITLTSIAVHPQPYSEMIVGSAEYVMRLTNQNYRKHLHRDGDIGNSGLEPGLSIQEGTTEFNATKRVRYKKRPWDVCPTAFF